MPKNDPKRHHHVPPTTNHRSPDAPDGIAPPPDELLPILLELVDLSAAVLPGLEMGDPLALRRHDGVYSAYTLIGSRVGDVKALDAGQLVGSAVRRIRVYAVGVHTPSCIIEVATR